MIRFTGSLNCFPIGRGSKIKLLTFATPDYGMQHG